MTSLGNIIICIDQDLDIIHLVTSCRNPTVMELGHLIIC